MPPGRPNAPRRHFVQRKGPQKTGPGTLDATPQTSPSSDAVDRLPVYVPMASGFHPLEYADITSARDRAEYDRAISRPTLLLHALHPSTDERVLSALFAKTILNVHQVRFIAPSRWSENDSRTAISQLPSGSAVVFVKQDTAKEDIDTTISKLQGAYIGNGKKLSVSAWVSSHLAETQLSAVDLTGPTLPARAFNATSTTNRHTTSGTQYNRMAPPTAGFGPPSNNTSTSIAITQKHADVKVTVKPPNDLQQIKLVQRVINGIAKHGAAFMLALQERCEVQSDPRFAFLFDPYSSAAIWAKWRYYELMSRRFDNDDPRRSHEKQVTVPDSKWKVSSEDVLPFQFCHGIADITLDALFDDDSYEPTLRGVVKTIRNERDADVEDGEWFFLNAFNRGQLIFLLQSLPTSHHLLTRLQVGNVVNFALANAGPGRSQEIVELLVRNLISPFNLRSNFNFTETALDSDNVERHDAMKVDETDHASDYLEDLATYHANVHKHADKPPTPDEDGKGKVVESIIVGTLVVSELLHASMIAQNSHTKKYRALFEEEFSRSRIFTRFGELGKVLNLGMIKTTNLRSRVHHWLSLQDGFSTFSKQTLTSMKDAFEFAARSNQADAQALHSNNHSSISISASGNGKSSGSGSRPGDSTMGNFEPIKSRSDERGEPANESEDGIFGDDSRWLSKGRKPGKDVSLLAQVIERRFDEPSADAMDEIPLSDVLANFDNLSPLEQVEALWTKIRVARGPAPQGM